MSNCHDRFYRPLHIHNHVMYINPETKENHKAVILACHPASNTITIQYDNCTETVSTINVYRFNP